MSRTDNTDPHWVRALWWEPYHWRCEYSASNPREHCDLPPEPIVSRNHSLRHQTRGHCTWVPTWDGMTTGGGWSAPPWFNRMIHTCPDRRRTRDDLTLARAQYRATGEVDVDVSTAQHRHCGRWDWW